ncbi:MAG: hypothetical protein J6K17_09310 [Oscillospiraceae bacterium]|nr:hypothetical protein [Oscillospiraceae bacterium]
MTIEKYIKNNAYKLSWRTSIAPNIPFKTLELIGNSFADDIPDTYVVAVGDATLFGKGTRGFAFSGYSLFFSNDGKEKFKIDFHEITAAEFIPCGKRRHDNMYMLDDIVRIYCRNGDTYDVGECLIGFDCGEFESFINGIVSLIDDGVEPLCTRQIVSVSDMSDCTKTAYVKTLCNYAYLNNSYIDPDSYSAIQNIIVRLELNAEVRNELRDYMQSIENKVKTGYLIKLIADSTDFGSFEVVRFALVQDVLYLHNLLKHDDAWQNDGFVGSMINAFGITPEQVDLLIEACRLNYKVTHSDNNLISMQSDYDALQKQAIRQNVPLISLYCAGSAYSIDTYFSIFGGRNKKQLSIDKQRELMLQEIIKNNQKTVNHLVEDMNEISEQLISELQKSMVANEKIKQLAALLGRLKAGATNTVDKVERTERLTLLNSIPQSLDQRKIKVSLNKDYYDIIQKSYVSKSGVLTLRENLSMEELTKLYRFLSDIGYPMNKR